VTSGIMRDEPVPGRPGGALEAFAARTARIDRRARRALLAATPGRPLPMIRLDDSVTIGPGGSVDAYGAPTISGSMAVVIDVWVDTDTYAAVTLRDDDGIRDSIMLGPGPLYEVIELDTSRSPVGDLLIVAGQITAGTGNLYLRARSAFG
jgi:hypothetical protein